MAQVNQFIKRKELHNEHKTRVEWGQGCEQMGVTGRGRREPPQLVFRCSFPKRLVQFQLFEKLTRAN